MKPTPFAQYFFYIFKFSTLLLLMLSPQLMMAQNNYKLSSEKENVIKILGAYNGHEWTMVAKDVKSTGLFHFNSSNDLIDVTSLQFTVGAKSLKGEKTAMDKRAYKSIKADQFPKVVYQLNYAEVTMIQANKYSIQTTGILTIAGKTQSVSIKVMALVNADQSISCHGTEKLMFTAYGIEPPSFMLGSKKVANELVIQFDLTFIK